MPFDKVNSAYGALLNFLWDYHKKSRTEGNWVSFDDMH